MTESGKLVHILIRIAEVNSVNLYDGFPRLNGH